MDSKIFIITCNGLYLGSSPIKDVPNGCSTKKDYLSLLSDFRQCISDYWLNLSRDEVFRYSPFLLSRCAFLSLFEGKLVALLDMSDHLSMDDIARLVYIYSSSFVNNGVDLQNPIIFDLSNNKFYYYE